MSGMPLSAVQGIVGVVVVGGSQHHKILESISRLSFFIVGDQPLGSKGRMPLCGTYGHCGQMPTNQFIQRYRELALFEFAPSGINRKECGRAVRSR
jgi:hypothetical protein